MTSADEKKSGEAKASATPLLAWLSLLLLPTLLGLVASAMLVVDYSQPLPLFCTDQGGGCEAVKKTMFATLPFTHIPTPYLGLSAYLVFGILLFLRGPGVRKIHWGLGVVGAIIATFFIVIQIRIGAFCKYCMAVDGSTLVLLAGVIRRKLGNWDPPPHRAFSTVSGISLGLSAAVPLTFAFLGDEGIPRPILEEIRKTPSDKVLVLDFADYECPHCRRVHEKLKNVLPSYGEKVHFVRKHVPLKHIHSHAETAARAAICAEEQGKGERMSDLLFSEPVAKLTKEGCEAVALAAELDLEKYKSCVSSDRPNARMEADTALFKAAHGLGLPSVWIGRKELRGSGYEESDYKSALDEAAKK